MKIASLNNITSFTSEKIVILPQTGYLRKDGHSEILPFPQLHFSPWTLVCRGKQMTSSIRLLFHFTLQRCHLCSVKNCAPSCLQFPIQVIFT